MHKSASLCSRSPFVLACALTVVASAAAPAADLGTASTYQGELFDSGMPVTDDCDFLFTLWDDATAGTMVAGPLPATVSVTDGRFTAELDFGPDVFNGEARWLEIEVCCPSACAPGYTPLTPRQRLTPAPHALALPGLWTQQSPTSPNLLGGHTANSVTTGATGVTIGGGGTGAYPNTITDDHGTVGGGQGNRAGNNAGPTTDASYATVSGGNGNQAGGASATVSGGSANIASGWLATVSGGAGNVASGEVSSVPGGSANTAAGAYSFAAGWQAKANHQGTFVWADSIGTEYASTEPDQFLIRAAGGVGIGTNSPMAQLDVGGSIHASGTIASGGSIIIDGTADKISTDANLELHVAHGRALRLETNATSPNLIGGSSGNSVTTGTTGATIGGGGSNGGGNRVTDNYGTVGGGAANQAGNAAGTTTDALYATVGGGTTNIASDLAATAGGGAANISSSMGTTVAGGWQNTASGMFSTVAGGMNNTASGGDSTVSGGSENTASANASMVPGGQFNVAGGYVSFAAGRRAKVRDAAASGDYTGDEGTFMWADWTDADFTSTGPNRFMVRASGGVYLYTSADLSTGSYLAAGSGTWSSVSDRQMKENLAPVDGREVLGKLAAIPISTWNYKTQDPGVRHMGPMAQDLYGAFGLGDSDKAITTIDADGVALAAIQGLYQMVLEKDKKIAELEARLAALESRGATLGSPSKGGAR